MTCLRFMFLPLRLGCNQVKGESRVSAITLKTTESNLTKLHRKIEHYEKVCSPQELDSLPMVKKTIRSEVKLRLNQV